MTKEEWETSRSAPEMLTALNTLSPTYLYAIMPVLHRYFIATGWSIEHLIPQKDLKNALIGAARWIDGEIDNEELGRLDWHAEAACFLLDDPESTEDFSDIQEIISGIGVLRNMKFDDARKQLLKAAYFVEGTLIYPTMNRAPFWKRLCLSEFLCPDLLRDFVNPVFPLSDKM